MHRSGSFAFAFTVLTQECKDIVVAEEDASVPTLSFATTAAAAATVGFPVATAFTVRCGSLDAFDSASELTHWLVAVSAPTSLMGAISHEDVRAGSCL